MPVFTYHRRTHIRHFAGVSRVMSSSALAVFLLLATYVHSTAAVPGQTNSCNSTDFDSLNGLKSGKIL